MGSRNKGQNNKKNENFGIFFFEIFEFSAVLYEPVGRLRIEIEG